ncbi:Uncharacterised protein [Vibrio cholerae]|nr:Uncharacterised protein [Vibrio cholerae]
MVLLVWQWPYWQPFLAPTLKVSHGFYWLW